VTLTAESAGKPGFSRRRFIIGSAGVSAVAALGGTTIRAPRALAATAPSGPPASTLPLPTTTEPEQLLLTWGANPATQVTVSWSAPGTVAQPAPTLAYSTRPITDANPGRLIKLPDPSPLDVTRRYDDAASVSFTDDLNGQTTYFYHVQLSELWPATRYYYKISDGAATPSDAGASFVTAPAGRAKYRFSSFGDLATPSWDLNTSGNIWHESCDNSWYAVTAIENPGDGKGAPLFHLLNGDLCYANLDVDNAPGVWRDFGNNIGRSAANRPWMPALGNHEVEFGTGTRSGHPGNAPGGIGAQGAAGNYWNGPYGYGHYLSRFLLPDNGVVNWDGNRLRGNFYTFQVGTVLFISLDADDVIYQDGAANYVIGTPDTAPEKTTTGAQIPNGATAYSRFYTGELKPDAKDDSLVPDYASGQPNLQTIWLEKTLAEARHDRSVDMIVVFMHQCAMSTSVTGNGSDLGIRQAWLPLFDKYEVDLVLSGHEHDYERTYPVRGYDAGDLGTVVAPNPGQTKGAKVDTRRPSVVTTEPYNHGGTPAWNTAEGTVYLVLGGGGTNGPTNTYGTDTGDDEAQAKVITTRNAVVGSEATGFTKNGADSVEDAPWSAAINPTDAYGYSIFDVDPGSGPGETTITFQYFAIPAVSNEAGTAHDGTTTLPTTPTEKFVFGRKVGRRQYSPPKSTPGWT
jgi:Purple acid Phosphatase, N-terminal domain/Calcineurin-like phosphoesterase